MRSDAPSAHLQHALLLIARMHGGDAATADAASRALAQWRASHPEHEIAYGQAQAGWDATRAEALRGELPLPLARQAALAGRRKALSLLGFGALAVGTGLLARWYLRAPVLELALSTPPGQTRAARLPDGTALELDARTQARVVVLRDRREVWLQGGEIRFEVATDAERPFYVVTAWGRVRVLGTVFTVEARGNRMRVRVAEGAVAVWAGALPAGADLAQSTNAADTVLRAGQGAVAEGGRLARVSAISPRDIAPWRQGWLVFDNTPLPEVVERWNDYLPVPLAMERDPALQGMRLTGSYRLRAPADFLESLPSVLPVRVQRAADGSARIVARR